MSKDIFSNGTEYQMFIETHCGRCEKYIEIDDIGNTSCKIETAMSRACMDEDKFPYSDITMEWVTTGKFKYPKWSCSEFEEKQKNPWIRFPEEV